MAHDDHLMEKALYEVKWAAYYVNRADKARLYVEKRQDAFNSVNSACEAVNELHKIYCIPSGMFYNKRIARGIVAAYNPLITALTTLTTPENTAIDRDEVIVLNANCTAATGRDGMKIYDRKFFSDPKTDAELSTLIIGSARVGLLTAAYVIRHIQEKEKNP